MTNSVSITVNGTARQVPGDVTVAAALLNLGLDAFRLDLSDRPRGPVCGMGTCFECRLTIDGIGNVRACLEPVREGMSVQTPP